MSNAAATYNYHSDISYVIRSFGDGLRGIARIGAGVVKNVGVPATLIALDTVDEAKHVGIR